MPTMRVRGVDLVYEVLGDRGAWVTVTPGGRRGMAGERALGGSIAEAGYRVLLHDRRNTGASGIAIFGESESMEQAEDLLALMQGLRTGPAFVAGSSSGARMSLLLARHHPEAVKALLLWRVTGGPYAAKRLAYNYYEQFLEMVASGGMEAICDTDHFAAMIAANPANRDTLLGMGKDTFTAGMHRWLESFRKDADYPVAGISPMEMRQMTLPAICIPGNDRVHPAAGAQAAHRLLPFSIYREVLTNTVDVDVDFDGWAAKTGSLASHFIDFLRACDQAL
jgi:pimeloyl-ACP methyl ester carboxylesterase